MPPVRLSHFDAQRVRDAFQRVFPLELPPPCRGASVDYAARRYVALSLEMARHFRTSRRAILDVVRGRTWRLPTATAADLSYASVLVFVRGALDDARHREPPPEERALRASVRAMLELDPFKLTTWPAPCFLDTAL